MEINHTKMTQLFDKLSFPSPSPSPSLANEQNSKLIEIFAVYLALCVGSRDYHNYNKLIF